jgi:hypothetical protein
MLLFANDGFAADKAKKEKSKVKDETEKVVTAAASLYSGDAVIVNQYLGDQEYKGPVVGAAVEFGAMYRRSHKVSWDLDLTYLGSSYSDIMEGNVSNPAGTSAYSMSRINADYGTYFNWNPVKNLSIKAGGSFDFLFGVLSGVPDHVNNVIDFDTQMQIKAGAGIRYGWNFRKTGLFFQANVEIPFMGMALSSSLYESSIDSMAGDEILPGTLDPFCFTSFHNLTGINADIEAELILRKTTLFFAYEMNHRAWNIFDLQNTRRYNMTRIGLKVDLVSRDRNNSSNRFF